MKTIKEFCTKRYEVQLVQLENGQYCVGFETTGAEKPGMSEPTFDLIVAMLTFDAKVLELDGH